MTGFEICPHCGAAIMAPARRCPRCGASQAAPAPPRRERPSGLHALTLGATSGLKVGDRIATISSPRGLSNTVSDGLVSAIRDDDGQRLIQISAPISPGSSGGPVFDLSGKVIGIATLQMTEGQNLNFATPIDSLRHILPRRENLTLAEFRKRARSAGAAADDEFTRAF